jgi:hypothetical protein
MHAAPYVVWAGFDRANFELTNGDPAAFRSSPNVVREFCPNCGSTITYRKEAGGSPELEEAARIIYIAVASLDDPSAYPPDEVVHGQERIGWLHLSDDIPMREFISPSAGDLQFGGIEQARTTDPAKQIIDSAGKKED